MNTFWRSKGSKAWVITSAIILILVLAVNIASSAFFDTVCIVLNSPQRTKLINEQNQYSILEGYNTREKAAEYGDQVTLNAAKEGFILLKNLDNALPLSKGAKVSVFGKNSVNIAYGGSGSGGGSDENAKSIFDSLTAAGFQYNPTLLNFYNDKNASGNGRPQNSGDLDSGKVINNIPTGETPWDSYTDQVKASFQEYNDAALIVISRIGGEGFDMARSYLKLDENEKKMIEEAGKSFDKVVVLLNVATSMEINDIAADNTVDAILWLGFPGNSGMMALGPILNGEVNPSGRTVDTFATLESNPTWNNFGGEVGMTDKYSGDAYLQPSGRLGNVDTGVYFVDEEEDIYVGYRYYETAYAEAQNGNYDAFHYDEAVAYPFGYGLSYTNFAWKLKNADALPKTLGADTSMTVEVEVTNDPAGVPGRDVVELYVTPPYAGGLCQDQGACPRRKPGGLYHRGQPVCVRFL